MSEPGVFAFTREGKTEIFADRWAGAMLRREIVWGPEALESFARNFHRCDLDELGYRETGVHVNYDANELSWSEDSGESPAILNAYMKLLRGAWPGFAILPISGQIQLRQPTPEEMEWEAEEDDEDENWFLYRSDNVKESAGSYDPDPDDPDDIVEEDDEEEFEPDEARAWVTILSSDNKHHRHLSDLPQTMFNPPRDLVQNLVVLKSATIPSDKITKEGAIIDVPGRRILLWGDPDFAKNLESIDDAWKDWSVEVIDGYQTHCQRADVQGVYASDAELLGELMPHLLSNVRFDMKSIMGAIGGGLKSKGKKAMGCLYLLIAIPIAIYGIFSGQWTAVLITLLATLLLFVVAFKWVEWKLRKSWAPVADMGRQPDESKPAVAGPQERNLRLGKMDELLRAADLPSLDELDQHFDVEEVMWQS